jgi:hypothetical protein
MQNALNANIVTLAAAYAASEQFTAVHSAAHAAQFTAAVAALLQKEDNTTCTVFGHSVKQNVLKLRYATSTVAARAKVLQKDAVVHSNITLLQTHNSVAVTQQAALLQFLQAQLNCVAQTQQTASSMLQQLTVSANVAAAVQQQAATQAACSSANAAAQHLQQIVAQAQQQQNNSIIVLA